MPQALSSPVGLENQPPTIGKELENIFLPHVLSPTLNWTSFCTVLIHILVASFSRQTRRILTCCSSPYRLSSRSIRSQVATFVRLQSEAVLLAFLVRKQEPCLHRARLLPWLVAELDRNPAQRECIAGDGKRVGCRPGCVRVCEGYGARTARRDCGGASVAGY